MKQPDEAWWIKARQARDQLAGQLLSHPSVSLIDIGLDPQGMSDTPVLRVHIRQDDTLAPNIPQDISGIAVRVIHGDYTLQHRASDPEL